MITNGNKWYIFAMSMFSTFMRKRYLNFRLNRIKESRVEAVIGSFKLYTLPYCRRILNQLVRDQ